MRQQTQMALVYAVLMISAKVPVIVINSIIAKETQSAQVNSLVLQSKQLQAIAHGAVNARESAYVVQLLSVKVSRVAAMITVTA